MSRSGAAWGQRRDGTSMPRSPARRATGCESGDARALARSPCGTPPGAVSPDPACSSRTGAGLHAASRDARLVQLQADGQGSAGQIRVSRETSSVPTGASRWRQRTALQTAATCADPDPEAPPNPRFLARIHGVAPIDVSRETFDASPRPESTEAADAVQDGAQRLRVSRRGGQVGRQPAVAQEQVGRGVRGQRTPCTWSVSVAAMGQTSYRGSRTAAHVVVLRWCRCANGSQGRTSTKGQAACGRLRAPRTAVCTAMQPRRDWSLRGSPTASWQRTPVTWWAHAEDREPVERGSCLDVRRLDSPRGWLQLLGSRPRMFHVKHRR